MKPTTLSSLVVLALAGSVWAASPYDLPYGIQWNFILGNDVADNPSSATISPDGSVWIATAGSGKTGAGTNLTWGNPTSLDGGHYASGFGQISRLGGILQGNDMKGVDGNGGHNQGYSPIVAFVPGDPKAYVSYSSNGSLWTDAVPGDVTTGGSYPKMWTVTAVDTSGGYDFDGTPATAVNGYPWLVHGWDATPPGAGISPLEKFTLDLVTTTAYGGSAHDVAMGASGAYYLARAAQVGAADPLTKGDTFTVGDFSGPAGQSYKPAVGKVVITNDGTTETQTLSGPAHQPACGGRSLFTDIDVNESANAGAGKVYACGYGYTSSGGTMNFLDPDGPGTDFAPIAFNPATPSNNKGFAIVYNATTWAIDRVVTWESTQGNDRPLDITATAAGGFVLVGITNGDMGGNTNPAPGTSDAYMEVYQPDGTLAWNYQTQTAVADNFGDATVDADGSIYVSGNSDGNPTLWKFTSGGTLVWTTTIDNAGTVESQIDHAGGKNGVFVLSQYNSTGGGTPWVNTLSYAPRGNNENLLQKLIPGDFNTDGFVDFADVQLAGAATKPGLPGNDTYDFNGDGDSTLADTTYMITNIMDRALGDIAQDSLVTDVDNADIGKAIGASGVGTLYLDGDMDWDGDVDAADITAVAGAFTRAKPSGKWANGSVGATLTYSPDDGQVWISASEAAGGIITSFQLENAAGTFVPAGYAGPAGGDFGGALEDATTHVIADTDQTLTGFTGVPSLGTIFPTGMDQAALEAYLTTAVYTGQPGSGQMKFKPVVVVLPADYEAWAATFPTLTDPDPALDFDGDGLATGVEFVLGGNPTLNDAAAVAPTSGYNGSDLAFTFRRTDVANNDPTATIVAEYGSDLTAWTQAQSGVDGVTIVENDNFYSPGIDQVIVTLPPNLAVNGRIFARLKVTITLPLTLLEENFETDDGGFTVVTAGGTPWAYGDPESPNAGGGAVTTGNGDSAKCWGTGLEGGYADGTDTSLRSPVIDLNGAAGATLSFAMAMDAPATHTLEVNVIDATTLAKTTVIAPFDDPDIDTTPWKTISVAIPAAALGKTVYLEWRFVGAGNGNYLGAYIDDVVVTVP